ncbi:hypothetical protein I79_008502 [Cricetulus griseus]|uniref:Uncharacterized protein n=1 Tax=Cricetulus griseus TaxID=10029 RepID=G3HDC1_CRIGR|nr:hypothetical protein I79_008502 [Cricetulus griseus]
MILIQLDIHAVVVTTFTFVEPLLSVSLQRHNQVGHTLTTNLTYTVLNKRGICSIIQKNCVWVNSHFHSRVSVLFNTTSRGNRGSRYPLEQHHFNL